MQDQGRVRVSLDEICLGSTCKYDIHDENEILLLGSGLPLTKSVLDQIVERGVSFLEVAPEDARALCGVAPSTSSTKRKSQTTKADPAGAFKSHLVQRGSERYSAVRAAKFRSQTAFAVAAISKIGSKIDGLTSSALKELCDIPIGMLEMLAEDSDQAIATISAETTNDHLADRCAKMSLFAINTAIELGMTESDVVKVGTAGLLHDLGLYCYPTKFRDPKCLFSSNEAWNYQRHSDVGANAFEGMVTISDEIRMIMRQVHERPDGSGYPRGISGIRIHMGANILNVVDAYLTLVDVGPERSSIVPHDAIMFLLHEGSRGVFDHRAVRSFLNQINLYPIGSLVELDDGRTATVTRRNLQDYASPLVQVHGEIGEAVLTDPSIQKIARPLMDRHRSQMRITREMMSTMTMQSFGPPTI